MKRLKLMMLISATVTMVLAQDTSGFIDIPLQPVTIAADVHNGRNLAGEYDKLDCPKEAGHTCQNESLYNQKNR